MAPIFDLTNAPKAFMKLGQIRKGQMAEGKRADGSKFTKPVDLDHFRVTFQPGPLQETLQAEFLRVYGPAPTEINVRFADPVIDEIWDANYECYKQGGLIAKAGVRDTGPYWIFYRDPQTSEVLVRNGSPVGSAGRAFMEKPIDLLAPIYKNAQGEGIVMEPVGRLQLVIPELAHIAIGFFSFQPTSVRDIRNITAELAAFQAVAKSYGGSITGVPFKLIRRLEEITKNIKGKLSKGPSYVVHIDAGGEWGRRAISTIEQLALPDIIDVESESIDEPLTDNNYPEEPISGTNALLMAPEYPPEPEEPKADPEPEPKPAKAKAPAKSAEKDIMINPLAVQSLEWAASADVWNTTLELAKHSIEKLIAAKRITNPMSKAEFKRAVKETV